MTENEKNPTGLLNSAEELRQLIIDNSDLPLLVFAGENCNSGDWSYMSCGYVKASKGEFLDCAQEINDERCYTDRDEFEEDIADNMAYDSQYEALPDDEFDALVKQKAAEYESYWKPCIILYVDN